MTPHEALQLQCEHILAHCKHHEATGEWLISCLEAAGDVVSYLTQQCDDSCETWDTYDYECHTAYEPGENLWAWLQRERALHPSLYPKEL